MDISSMKDIMVGESIVKKRRLLDALVKVSDSEYYDVAYIALKDKSEFIGAFQTACVAGDVEKVKYSCARNLLSEEDLTAKEFQLLINNTKN